MQYIQAPTLRASAGVLAWLFKRRLGFAALRGLARLRLDGLGRAGTDPAAHAVRCARRDAAACASRAAWRRWTSAAREDFGPRD